MCLTGQIGFAFCPSPFLLLTPLWARWGEMGDDVDGYATLRSTETAVVVLEPRTERSDQPPR